MGTSQNLLNSPNLFSLLFSHFKSIFSLHSSSLYGGFFKQSLMFSWLAQLSLSLSLAIVISSLLQHSQALTIISLYLSWLSQALLVISFYLYYVFEHLVIYHIPYLSNHYLFYLHIYLSIYSATMEVETPKQGLH